MGFWKHFISGVMTMVLI